MKIYTRGGDGGETSLLGGDRVAKNDPRIEAYGTVDELNSFLGLARAIWQAGPIDGELARIQADLFEVGAKLASPGSDRFPGPRSARIDELERAIDALEDALAPLQSFILPGGSQASAQIHVCRSVCRRAERLVVALHDGSDDLTVRYLNRLSDYLFVAARYANAKLGFDDVAWKHE